MACIAALCAAATSCASLRGRVLDSPSVAGAWIDLLKSTPADTMVWLLAPNGDDGLLQIHLGVGGRRETRRHYGRWRLAAPADGGGRELCFLRRPGRDAASCVPYVLDTLADGGAVVRRLRLRGYVGEHHTGDRTLIERRARTVPVGSGTVATFQASSTTGAAGGGAAGGGAAGGGAAGGFHPRAVQPERPSVATHAGTVAPGYAELETGVERDQLADGTRAVGVPSVLKLGLTRKVQLALAVPAAGATGVSFGAGDLSVGLKWRLVEDRPVLQDVALLPTVKLATGGARGTGTTDASLLLIDSRTLGPVGLDLNAGATWRSGDGTQAPRTATLWTVSAGIPLHGPLGWALECYGYPGTAGPAGNPPVVAVLAGPTLVLHSTLEVDAGFITPVAGPQPHALYVGLVTNLGRYAPRRQ